MSEENTILDFDAALNALNNASNLFKIDVFIPSKGSTLIFKEIDAKQQKNLLNAAMDGAVYNTKFVKTFYDILKENLLEENKDIIDTLTVNDKAFIAIYLRSQISNDINVAFNEDFSSKIDLKTVLDKFSSYKSPQNVDLEIKNENVSVSVNVGLPNLKTELEYDENFSKFYKDLEKTKDKNELQEVISEAFISETTKYINSVTINSNKFDFIGLTYAQKVRIVEKLPSGIIQKILEAVSNWKKDLDSVLTVVSGEHTKVLTIDSLLFLS
jgi:disulfide oxidoreductase YuzD